MNGRLSSIQAYPETFFVDKNGNITGETYSGARTGGMGRGHSYRIRKPGIRTGGKMKEKSKKQSPARDL